MTTLLTIALVTNMAIVMTDFDYCFNKLISDRYEGSEYSNDPHDLGGETKWGITKQVARDYGYDGAMEIFPKAIAKKIYHALYWEKLKCYLLPQKLAFEVFEVGVHGGIRHDGSSQSVELLQKAINIFLFGYQIDVDGHLGSNTLTALEMAIKTHGEQKIKLWYNIFQGNFYYAIAERNPSQRKYLVGGWTNRLEFK